MAELHFTIYSFEDLERPSFLGSFKGLTNTQPSKLNSVRGGFIQAWEVNGVIKMIESLLKAKIKGEDGDELFIDKAQVDAIVGSAKVAQVEFKNVGGLANTHINVYLDYHPFDNQQWSKLREYARKMTHIIQFHRKGEMIQHDWACHGIDHPLGLCPFNNLEIDIPLLRLLVPKPRIMTNEGNSNSYQTAGPTQTNNTGQ